MRAWPSERPSPAPAATCTACPTTPGTRLARLSRPATASLPTWQVKVSRPPADLARTPAFAFMTWGVFSPSWTPSCLASSNAGTSSTTALRVARGEGELIRTSWRRLGGLQSAQRGRGHRQRRVLHHAGWHQTGGLDRHLGAGRRGGASLEPCHMGDLPPSAPALDASGGDDD